MKFKTADLCDEFYEQGVIALCQPVLMHFGANRRFYGKIRTISCFEDNVKVRETLFGPGDGNVLVVDAGGSQRCAMLGDILAGKAVENGWSGIIMNGYIRDSADIEQMAIGVRALGTFPLKSEKHGLGEVDVPVAFAGVRFVPGDYLYADEDGIICSRQKLI